ncbi:MAG: sulfatase-like hydrolase/transferase [Planctomycetota bacterium]
MLASRFRLAQGFASYDEELRGRAGGALASNERDARAVTDAALGWLAARPGGSGSSRPFFYWLHYFDPHAPYRPPVEYAAASTNDETRYLGEVRYMDAQLGRLVAELERRGDLARTVFVLTADHGESLHEHGEPTHGVFVYDATIRVPLILSLPFAKEATIVEHTAVSHVDVVPTLLALLGLPAAEGLDGRDLFAAPASADRGVYAEAMLPRYHHGWAPLFGWRTRDRKFVRAPEPELYALDRDPGESRNLLPGAGDEARRLDEALEALAPRAGGDEALAPAEGEVDAELAARLAALGYARGAGSRGAGGPEDPKRMLPLYLKTQEAMVVSERGDPKRGREILRRVLRGDPGNAKAWEFAAMINLKLDETAEAEACIARSLELLETAPLRLMHGQVLLKLDRHEDAEVELARALELEPGLAEVHIARGDGLAIRGRFEEALTHYRRAAEVDPDVAGKRAAVKIARIEALIERRGR